MKEVSLGVAVREGALGAQLFEENVHVFRVGVGRDPVAEIKDVAWTATDGFQQRLARA